MLGAAFADGGRDHAGVAGIRKGVIVTGDHQAREDNATGMKCALCGMSLTGENASREHVFPNAIGGRKRVGNFLCVACNSRTGSDWDDELVRQFRPLCTMLNVNRARGRNRRFVVETVSDRRLALNPDGSMTIAEPLFEAQELDGKTAVKIRARTTRELRSMLSGLQRKHPQIDVDQLVKRAERIQEYSSEPYAVSLTVGGPLAGRSMIKSCLSMVYDAGFDIGHCEEAERYLLKGGEPCFGYYTERDAVRNRPEKTFFHCVHVRGDPERRQLLAYVEYFGWLRFVACLSRNYERCAFSHSYAIDPVSGKELDLNIVLEIDRADFQEFHDGRKVDYGEVARDLGVLVEAWREMDVDRARAHAIEDALAFACEACGIGEGDILTDEQAARLARVVSNRLAPFLAHTILGSQLTEDDLRAIERKSRGARTDPGAVHFNG